MQTGNFQFQVSYSEPEDRDRLIQRSKTRKLRQSPRSIPGIAYPTVGPLDINVYRVEPRPIDTHQRLPQILKGLWPLTLPEMVTGSWVDPGVAGAVDQAHASFTLLFCDLEMPERFADLAEGPPGPRFSAPVRQFLERAEILNAQ